MSPIYQVKTADQLTADEYRELNVGEQIDIIGDYIVSAIIDEGGDIPDLDQEICELIASRLPYEVNTIIIIRILETYELI